MSQVPSACNHVTLKICWWPVLRPDYSHTYSILRTKPNPDGRCRLQYTYAYNLRKFRYSYYRDWLLVAMTIGTRFPCVAAFTVYTCMLIINSTNYSRSKFVLLSFSIFVYLKIGGQSYLVQYSSTYMVTGSTPYGQWYYDTVRNDYSPMSPGMGWSAVQLNMYLVLSTTTAMR